MKSLTAQQEAFCHEYLIDLNGTQAAIRAGYTPSCARQTATEILSYPHVRARVKELMDLRKESLMLDAGYVLERLTTVASRSMQAEPVMAWDPVEKCMRETGEYTFDSTGANRALELIGRHLGLFEKDNKQKAADPMTDERFAALLAAVRGTK